MDATTFDPVCYFITFRTYGSWLHGDARGSVDAPRNVPGVSRIPPVPRWEAWERRSLRHAPVLLTDAQRAVVADAIRAKATERGWLLEGLNVRTNHVHMVLTARMSGETVLHDAKAFSTRAMRKAGLLGQADPVWSRGGSVATLRDPDAIVRAVYYVLHEQ